MRWPGPAAIVNNRPNSRQGGCYIKIMTAGVQWRKEIVGISIKAFGAK
jgi:hypothetical protein